MSEQSTGKPNHLIHESSPYLLQHAYNPVDWYPWGEEALEKARKEEKMLLVSIGYAACHWCHVMEAESFSDPEVAAYMNDHFVCIKIDREERPDIDQIYMDAVQILTGRGGWPLNCLALPDGRPIYGGTYFPRARWMEFLRYMVDFVRDNPEKTIQQANQLTAGVQNSDIVKFEQDPSPHQLSDLNALVDRWMERIDMEYGGHQGNIKFALPTAFEFLLQYHVLTDNREALEAVLVTLDRMAEGGIYDQIGGGFARYATDRTWKVPHFEKMLYDNAQLVSLYCHGYQVSGNEQYKKVVFQTLDFVHREMSDPSGGFYSALDADSEGEEGLFYVWTYDEMKEVLGHSYQAGLVADYYQVTEEGNWEGKNILHRQYSPQEFAQLHDMPAKEWTKVVEVANVRLLEMRNQRIRPALDDKILTSWNGMMMQAFAAAFRTFGREEDRETAVKTGEFLLDKMKRTDGGLFRNHKDGKSTINGFLDDYAFIIAGFIELYQATFQEKWLEEAQRLLDYAIDHFYEPEKWMFYYTSRLDPKLVARKMEIPDNVIPSSNSQMARNLYMLGTFLDRKTYLDMAQNMVRVVKRETLQQGPYFANWAGLMAWFIHPPYEVAIVGDDWAEVLAAFNKRYLPFAFLSGGADDTTLPLLEHKYQPNRTLIYVCREKVCQQPEEKVEDAWLQMKKMSGEI